MAVDIYVLNIILIPIEHVFVSTNGRVSKQPVPQILTILVTGWLASWSPAGNSTLSRVPSTQHSLHSIKRSAFKSSAHSRAKPYPYPSTRVYCVESKRAMHVCRRRRWFAGNLEITEQETTTKKQPAAAASQPAGPRREGQLYSSVLDMKIAKAW